LTGTLIPWIALLFAAASVTYAIRTHRFDANTNRSEFLLQLHRVFFFDETYRPIRRLLDDSGDHTREQLQTAIREESQELTDFLNFFELVAYFEANDTLRSNDVQALLGYYLDLLKADSEVLHYVTSDGKSFEYLSGLLGR